MKVNRDLLLLFLCIFVDSIGWGIVFPVFDTLIIGNSANILSAGTSLVQRNMYYELLIGVYCIGMFLSSPVLGAYSDQYGRKKLLMLSLLGGAFGFLICGFGVYAQSLTFIFIGRIISGITAGNFAVAQAAIADKSDHTTLSKNLSLIVIANGVGFSCGPLLGGFLFNSQIFSHVSYFSPFIIVSILLLLIAVLLKVSFKETHNSHLDKKVNILLGFKQIYEAFSFKKVRAYFSTLLLFMIGYTIFFSYLPLYLGERFSDNGTLIGYILTYFAIIFTLGLIVFLPKMTKSFSLKNISSGSLLIQLVSCVIFLLLFNQILIFLPLTFIALTVPFIYVAQVSLISQNTADADQGKAMGVVGSIAAFSWGVGPLSAAFLTSLGNTFVSLISLSLLFVALAISFLRK